MRLAVKDNPSAMGFESAAELDAPIGLDVVGEIPRWLDGRLVHTGPALYDLPGGHYTHWFDGLAQLGAIAIADGKATHRSRFLRSEAYRAARAEGRPVLGEFGTRPHAGVLRDLMAHVRPPHPTDNANVNVVDVGGCVFAMTESSRHVEFDPVTLETIGEVSYDDDLQGQLSTAHPHLDVGRGVLYNLLTELGRRSTVHVYEQPTGSLYRRRVASLEVPRPHYTHSFATTENFIVLTQQPLVVNPLKMRFSTKPYFDRYDWRPTLGSRIVVIRKDDGHVQASATFAPQFVFHHANAYELDGMIDVDMITYPDPSAARNLTLAALRTGGATVTGRLVRLSLRDDVLDQQAVPVELVPDRIELPRVHPASEQRPYRYVFAVSNADPRDHLDRIVKVDLDRRTTFAYSREATFFNEPQFVPAPAAGGVRAEDDGVLLVIAFDARSRVSTLLVLDARRLEVLADARLPQIVPFFFHGQWLSARGTPPASIG